MAQDWENFGAPQETKAAPKATWEEFGAPTEKPTPETSPYQKAPWFSIYQGLKNNTVPLAEAPTDPKERDRYYAVVAKQQYEAKQNKKSRFGEAVERQGSFGLSPETRKMLGADDTGESGILQPIRNLPANVVDLGARALQGLQVGLEGTAKTVDDLIDSTGINDVIEKYTGNKLAPGQGALALMEAFPNAGLEHGITHFRNPKFDVIAPERRAQLTKEAEALFNAGANKEQMNRWARDNGMVPYGKDLDEAIARRDQGKTQQIPDGVDPAEGARSLVANEGLADEAKNFKGTPEPKPEDLFPVKKEVDPVALEAALQKEAEAFKGRNPEEPVATPEEPRVQEIAPVDARKEQLPEDVALLEEHGLAPSHFASEESLQEAADALRILTNKPRTPAEPVSYEGPVSQEVTPRVEPTPELTRAQAEDVFRGETEKPKTQNATEWGRELQKAADDFQNRAKETATEAEKATDESLLVEAPTEPKTVTPEETVAKLKDAVNRAATIGAKVQRRLTTDARRERLARAKAIREQVPGEEGLRASLSVMRGELPKTNFEGVRDQFSPEEINGLFDHLASKDSGLTGYENIRAQVGLRKLLDGELPQPSEIKLLDKAYGKDIARTLVKHRSMLSRLSEGAADVLNLPRSLMSTFDLSAPFTQGAFMMGRKEFWTSFDDMFKAFGSEKAFDGVMKSIQESPNYPWMEEGKLALSDIHGHLSGKEEQFMSNLAEKIPGIGRIVKASERAYTAFLNKLRADTFNNIFEKAKAAGLDPVNDPKFVEDLGKFINNATGRGDLGKYNVAAPLLSGVLFSPRLMASRINMLRPDTYIKLHPAVRKEALKSLVAFAGIATTALALAKVAGAEVEDDPRSSDFAKIKTGNTRYNILGGFGPYIVLGARLATDEKKNIKGEVSSLDGKKFGSPSRLGVIGEFGRSKLAPVPSFVADYLDNKDMTGQPFEVKKAIATRLTPMLLQDWADLIKENGAKGIPMGVPGIFGIATQTYDVRKTNKELKEEAEKPWENFK